jgi:RNA polymerase sigma-32 factor
MTTMLRVERLSASTGEALHSRYLEEIWRFPMLEPGEEYMLAKSWREHGDRDAAQMRHFRSTSEVELLNGVLHQTIGFRGALMPAQVLEP